LSLVERYLGKVEVAGSKPARGLVFFLDAMPQSCNSEKVEGTGIHRTTESDLYRIRCMKKSKKLLKTYCAPSLCRISNLILFFTGNLPNLSAASSSLSFSQHRIFPACSRCSYRQT